MKKTNKFAYILLIIVIIIILILSYMLMTKNTTIQRQAQEIETMTATTDNAYALNSAHKNEDIKVWNKTYAHNDYTWEGVELSKSGYESLTTSSIKTSSIKIDLDESETIDVSRIQAWTIRLWASESPDSTTSNGYGFIKSRGTDTNQNKVYWYELPILHADYNPDLKLIFGSGYGNLKDSGKIRKHYENRIIGGTNAGTVIGIIESEYFANSYWCVPTQIGKGNYINFTYSSMSNGSIQIDFTRDDYSPYQVRGYIVADITIYYK